MKFLRTLAKGALGFALGGPLGAAIAAGSDIYLQKRQQSLLDLAGKDREAFATMPDIEFGEFTSALSGLPLRKNRLKLLIDLYNRGVI